MKFNWGTGIVLAFIGFISFIMFFIIKVNINDKYDHDLVTEKYYQKELAFQNTINKEKNAKTLKDKITWKKTTEGIMIQFPESFKAASISGKVFLYRPSNKSFDFEIPLSISNGKLLIPKTRLLDGRWNLSIDWVYQGKPYLVIYKIVY